tara:strand:- start:252 stop:830 length:579 start_codon:yes stop_codon:yes gene_type:complete
MDKNFFIIDNFYNNPDEVRQFVLNREFLTEGNYPGFRTGPEAPEQHQYLKTFFEQSVIKKPITYWPEDYNTAYQITTEESTTWIHHDDTTWAAVLYLSPDAPAESGTGIYRHKESGVYQWDGVKDSATDFNHSDFLGDNSMDQWEQIAFVGNLYNRLVCYKGSLYHRSVLPGFGTDKYSGRLFQTFFFDTQQ